MGSSIEVQTTNLVDVRGRFSFPCDHSLTPIVFCFSREPLRLWRRASFRCFAHSLTLIDFMRLDEDLEGFVTEDKILELMTLRYGFSVRAVPLPPPCRRGKSSLLSDGATRCV